MKPGVTHGSDVLPGGAVEEVTGSGWDSKARRLATGLIRVVVSLGLLAFLLAQVDLGEIAGALARADWRFLGAALALYLAGVVLRAYRWQGLMRALGYPATLSRLTVLYFVGAFFSNLLPTGVGGDVVRAFEVARDGAGAAPGASSVLVDRVAGLLTLLAMALVALIPGYRLVTPQVAAFIAVVCLGSFAGVGLLALADRWRGWAQRLPGVAFLARHQALRDFYNSFRAYGRPALTRALLISLAFNVLLIVVNILLAWAVGVRVSPWYFVLFVPIISFTLVLPISVSGLGVREGAYVLLFVQAGVPAALALTISLAFYALNVVVGVIGGVMYAAGVKG